MKRKRAPPPFFSHVPPANLHPQLAAHVETTMVKSAMFDEIAKRYSFIKAGGRITCGGLVYPLMRKFYPHYVRNRSRRDKKTRIKGSSEKQGKTVDRQLTEYTLTGAPPKRMSKMTGALIKWFRERGHEPQAAQLPVEIPAWFCMTQADYITRCRHTGQLWLWEVKTGAPIGVFVAQGVIANLPGPPERCTGINIWHLQLHHTRKALEAAGIPIAESRVLQIHGERGTDEHKIIEHFPPGWTARIPPFGVLGVPNARPWAPKVLNGKHIKVSDT